jgi:hypothetical protein
MTHLFLNKKTIPVQYYGLENNLYPKFMEKEIKQTKIESFGCPAISSMNKRIFDIFPMVSMEIEFWNDGEKAFYEYQIDKKNFGTDKALHDLINDQVVIDYTDKAMLQIKDKWTFVTDHKDLYITLIPNENLKTKNTEFIFGSFYPYGWIRGLNLALKQKDKNKKSKVILDENEAMFRVLFSKAVDLKRVDPTEEMLNYEKYQYDITLYLRNISSRFNGILAKRPKRLLR